MWMVFNLQISLDAWKYFTELHNEYYYIMNITKNKSILYLMHGQEVCVCVCVFSNPDIRRGAKFSEGVHFMSPGMGHPAIDAKGRKF